MEREVIVKKVTRVIGSSLHWIEKQVKAGRFHSKEEK